MEKEKFETNVNERLSWWVLQIANAKGAGLNHLSTISEDIAVSVLNCLYEYKLSNLNWDRADSPAIDLGDKATGIAFQVTSTLEAAKFVKNTTDFFQGLEKEYRRGIRFLVLRSPDDVAKLKHTRRIKNLSQTTPFLPGEHIIGTRHLLNKALEVYETDNPRALRFLEILKREFPRLEALKDTSPPDVSISRLPVTDATLYGREAELAALDEAWGDAGCGMITVIAWGGVGKTALVNRWLKGMRNEGYRGARRVYGWSFYSQGAAEGTQGSADEFLLETLTWFGDGDATAGTSHEKGKRLARLVREKPTLLILDGLEPLQYPHRHDGDHGLGGGLKDPGLKVFLKELAGHMRGLCVVSSRESLTDLRSHWDGGVRVMELAHLTTAAGTALLKGNGVWGTEADLTAAAEEYEGHALALRLAASYLKRRHKGDVRRRDRIVRLTDEEEQGKHARRVMAQYEGVFIDYPKRKFLRRFKWFQRSTPQLCILYMLGLFDRPAPAGALAVLRAEPAIAGLTDAVTGLDEEDWNEALTDLREAGLLAEPEGRETGNNDTLDGHPLVREFFGERLKEKQPGAWKEAHKRLYHYYKDLPNKELPDTLAEMEPLFAAVAHGCKAGLELEAEDIYWTRILRGNESFLNNKIGAFGSDIAVLSNFFKKPWSQPAPELPADKQAVVLSWSAFGLRALGRLREAVEPVKAGMALSEEQEDWKGAAIDASNLSELLLTLGDVSEAMAVARRGVSHADRSDDWFWKMGIRSTLADALHQWGRLGEAAQWFREAEAAQRERQPEYPYLYSLRGFQFCDLLLSGTDDGKGTPVQEVRERAEKTLEWAKTQGGLLLDEALNYLTLGRTWLMEAERPHTPATADAADRLKRARHHLDRAVAGLRESGNQDDLPRGLLARARCLRLQGEREAAAEDLKECREIAVMGEMKLHLADYYIEMYQVEGREEDLRRGKVIVEETEYLRRREELERLIINC